MNEIIVSSPTGIFWPREIAKGLVVIEPHQAPIGARLFFAISAFFRGKFTNQRRCGDRRPAFCPVPKPLPPDFRAGIIWPREITRGLVAIEPYQAPIGARLFF